MTEKYVAISTIVIDAPPSRVWSVITDPESLGELFFGSEVITDWTVGGPIIWRGEWEGKPFEDKGEIIAFEPGRRLETTHFSPLTGQPDVPENYHTLTWTLEPSGTQTVLTLMQDNNDSPAAAEHSKGMWDMLVATVKDIAERTGEEPQGS
jgi:uncharacterized protein YndB with AHSA1/START domain